MSKQEIISALLQRSKVQRREIYRLVRKRGKSLKSGTATVTIARSSM